MENPKIEDFTEEQILQASVSLFLEALDAAENFMVDPTGMAEGTGHSEISHRIAHVVELSLPAVSAVSFLPSKLLRKYQYFLELTAIKLSEEIAKVETTEKMMAN